HPAGQPRPRHRIPATYPALGAVRSGGRRQVVEGDPPGRGGQEVRRDPRRDGPRRAGGAGRATTTRAATARSATPRAAAETTGTAAAGDEVVDAPAGHQLLELGEGGRRVGAVE